MKKAMFILPVMMAFTLSGCSLLNNIFKKNSSNGSQTSQQGSGSGSQQSGSGSQSGGQGGSEFTIKKSTAGISADIETAITYTVGSVDFIFNQGVKSYTGEADEFGLKSNGTLTMKSKDSRTIKKIVTVVYKYNNNCPIYAGESASGTSITGNVTSGTPGTDKEITIEYANLNNAAYTYKNIHTSNSWYWSITVTLG